MTNTDTTGSGETSTEHERRPENQGGRASMQGAESPADSDRPAKSGMETLGIHLDEDFELEVLQEDPWRARVYWAPKGRRTPFHVLLHKRGNVFQVDFGSRDGGGRRTTGQTDPQLAAAYVEEALRTRVRRELVYQPDMDEIEEAGGDLNLLQCKNLAISSKSFQAHAENHKEQAIRGWDNLIAIKGPTWSILQVRPETVKEYYRVRTTETIRYPEWLERPRPTLPPCGKGTAAKELALVAAGTAHVAGLRRQSDDRFHVLRFDPFADDDVSKAMIAPSSVQGPPKRALTTSHLTALLIPEELADGSIRPSPVEEVDPTGQLELIVETHYNFARRRRAVLNALRGHIAETEHEVRRMLQEIDGPVRPEWAPYCPHGVFRFPGELDKKGYERIGIINADFKEALDRYDESVGWRSWEPERPLFGDPKDPMKPVAEGTIYNTPEQRRAKPGESYWNAQGEQLVAEGGELCFREDGEILTNGHNGGRYQRARQIARDRAIARGEDPDLVMPIYSGEVAHGWRVGWAQRVKALGYGRKVNVEDVGVVDLDESADYLGSWVTKRGVKAERYVQLDPDVLWGIASFQDADEVLPRIRQRVAREVREEREAVRRMRQLRRRRR